MKTYPNFLDIEFNNFSISDVVDHWFRICSQRKGAMEDESLIQLSLELVLNNAHRILNKSKLRILVNKLIKAVEDF